MNENDLRDCFAMFALNGILSCDYSVDESPAVLAYKYADEMLEARKKEEKLGIAAVKTKRQYVRKADYK
jgi:hypothetical protein